MSTFSMPLAWLGLVLGPLGFVGFWMLLVWGISWAGGWSRLCRNYRASQPTRGECWASQTGYVGTGRYRGCLSFTVNSEGLGVAVSPIFRVAHPPLFIPWSDVKLQPAGTDRSGALTELTLRLAPDVRIRVPQTLARKLRQAAGTPES